jgi:hypothetical protein
MQIPNTVIQQLAGRLPAGASAAQNTTVNLLPAGQVFPDQVRTVDMRFAKILRFGRTRSDIAIDLYNLFNTNTPTAYNQTFPMTNTAAYLRPTQIVDPRFLRFSVTVHY